MAEDVPHPVTPVRRPRKKPRLGHVIFLIVAVAATLALAWWQWTRFRSGSGTFQNLGYALQWPAFGAFLVYGYRKYLVMENNALDAENDHAEAAAANSTGSADSADSPQAFVYEAPKVEQAGTITEIDAGFLPERPTMDISEFNARNRPRRRGNEDLGGLSE